MPDRSQILELLRTNPERIADLTAGLTAAQLQKRPEPDEWSVAEVLAHLRSCATLWGEYMAAIIARDETTFRVVNPAAWIEQTDYMTQKFAPAWQAYARQRAGLLTTLAGLSEAEWAHTATITGAGAPMRKNVLYYATRLATHERGHLRQLRKTIEKL
ncbi:MAG: DinB family protein [Hamadaea sp.]|uniref:DinB family protein n=1 Tax=Hamadaea sp. TaxID=2024425 RepID=UPI0018105BCB|nr:DinB family protein [Hamadaea sp.]NUR72173.1 DinB family protein [Hamadaea sp.]NUT22740.1 DinB family protein [Hamadaea sp.]